MTQIDPKLLNKLRAIKALRDRAGTDGERDAAQHKLTIIMAKHKLTEQDVPSDSFSTRGRISFHHQRTTHQKMSDFRGNPHPDPQRDFWDKLNRQFQDLKYEQEVYIREYEREYKARQKRPSQEDPKAPNSSDPVIMETSRKVMWRGALLYAIGAGLGYAVSRSNLADESQVRWTVFPYSRPRKDHKMPYPDFAVVKILTDSLMRDLKVLCVTAKQKHHPSNPNSFDRAFYEEATYVIRERLAMACDSSPIIHNPKAKNPDGIATGRTAGLYVSLYPVA